MVPLLFIPLIIALIGLYICVNATDEIVQVTAALTTLGCLFLILVFTPMVAKLIIVVALVFGGKYNNQRANSWSRHHN